MSKTLRTQPDPKSPPRFVLAIELSNPSASPEAHAVALFEAHKEAHKSGAELVGSMKIPAGVRSSDGIMVALEALCRAHGCAPGDLSRVMVSIGAGGYTALRISTTIAKVLVETIGCELVAIPSARIAACAIKPADRPALIALASKGNHAHCSRVEPDGSIEAVGVIEADRLESLGISTLVGDTHLPVSFVERAGELGIKVQAIELDARNCFDASTGLSPIEPSALGPIYAREPDAVIQWRARKH